jgi:hypothetical protein
MTSNGGSGLARSCRKKVRQGGREPAAVVDAAQRSSSWSGAQEKTQNKNDTPFCFVCHFLTATL